MRSGKVDGHSDPKVDNHLPAIVRVDGDNGFAPLAIERGIPHLAAAARNMGVGIMAIAQTHHYSALWPETEALAEQGLAGFACVCNTPVMAPCGGDRSLFGTNPISFSWPRNGKPPVTYDMATSSMSHGDILLAARDGRDIPPGCGVDANGEPTTNPVDVLAGALLPFGGHKGSALALMVELLAAGAIGERFSFEAGLADNGDGGPARGGEFILAISPDLLAGENWEEHCETFFQQYEGIRGAKLPGARRHALRKSNSRIAINRDLLKKIRKLCD